MTAICFPAHFIVNLQQFYFSWRNNNFLNFVEFYFTVEFIVFCLDFTVNLLFFLNILLYILHHWYQHKYKFVCIFFCRFIFVFYPSLHVMLIYFDFFIFWYWDRFQRLRTLSVIFMSTYIIVLVILLYNQFFYTYKILM